VLPHFECLHFVSDITLVASILESEGRKFPLEEELILKVIAYDHHNF
jgi:hypothetical protein